MVKLAKPDRNHQYPVGAGFHGPLALPALGVCDFWVRVAPVLSSAPATGIYFIGASGRAWRRTGRRLPPPSPAISTGAIPAGQVTSHLYFALIAFAHYGIEEVVIIRGGRDHQSLW